MSTSKRAQFQNKYTNLYYKDYGKSVQRPFNQPLISNQKVSINAKQINQPIEQKAPNNVSINLDIFVDKFFKSERQASDALSLLNSFQSVKAQLGFKKIIRNFYEYQDSHFKRVHERQVLKQILNFQLLVPNKNYKNSDWGDIIAITNDYKVLKNYLQCQQDSTSKSLDVMTIFGKTMIQKIKKMQKQKESPPKNYEPHSYGAASLKHLENNLRQELNNILKDSYSFQTSKLRVYSPQLNDMLYQFNKQWVNKKLSWSQKSRKVQNKQSMENISEYRLFEERTKQKIIICLRSYQNLKQSKISEKQWRDLYKDYSVDNILDILQNKSQKYITFLDNQLGKARQQNQSLKISKQNQEIDSQNQYAELQRQLYKIKKDSSQQILKIQKLKLQYKTLLNKNKQIHQQINALIVKKKQVQMFNNEYQRQKNNKKPNIQLNKLKNQNEKLPTEAKKIKLQVNNKFKKDNIMKNIQVNYEEKYIELQKHIKQIDNQIKKSKAQSEQQINKKHEQIQLLLKQIKNNRDLLEKQKLWHKQYQAASYECSKLNLALQQSKQSLNIKSNQNAHLLQTVNELEKKIRDINAKYFLLQDKIKLNQSNLTKMKIMQEQISKKQRQIFTFKQLLTKERNNEQQLKTVSNLMTRCKQENQKIKSQYDGLILENQRQNENYNKLKNRYVAYEKQISDSKKSLKDKDGQNRETKKKLDLLQQIIKKMEIELAKKKQDIEKWVKQIRPSLLAQIQNLKEANQQDLRREKQYHDEQNHILNTEIEKLQQRCVEYQLKEKQTSEKLEYLQRRNKTLKQDSPNKIQQQKTKQQFFTKQRHQLRMKVKEKEDELMQKSLERQKLQDQIIYLENELINERRIKTQLLTKKERQQSNIQENQDRIKSLSLDIEVLNAYIKNQKIENQKLVLSLEQKETNLQNVLKELSILKERVNYYQNIISEKQLYKQQSNQLTNKHRRQQLKIKQLQQLLQKQKKSFQKIKCNSEDLYKKITQSKSTIISMGQQLQKKQKRIKKLQEQNQNNQNCIKENQILQAETITILKLLGEQRQNHLISKTENTEISMENEKLIQKVLSLEIEKSKLNEELSFQRNQISQYQNHLDKIKKDCEQQQFKFSDLNENLKIKGQQLKIKINQLKTLKQQSNILHQEFQQLKSQKINQSKLNVDLLLMQTLIQQLQIEITENNKELEQWMKVKSPYLQNQIKKLKEDNEKLLNRNQAMNKLNQTMQNELERLEGQNVWYKERYVQLIIKVQFQEKIKKENQIKNQQIAQHLRQTQSELSKLKQQNEEIKNNNTQLLEKYSNLSSQDSQLINNRLFTQSQILFSDIQMTKQEKQIQREDNNFLIIQIKQQDEQLLKNQREAQDMRNRISSIQKMLFETQKQKYLIEQRKDSLEKQKNSIYIKLFESQQNIKSYSIKIEQAKQQISQLKQKNREALHYIEEKNSSLEDALRIVKQLKSKNQQTIKMMEERQKQMIDDRQNLIKIGNDRQAYLTDIQERLMQAERTIEQIKLSSKELKKKVEQANTTIDLLQKQIQDRDNDIKGLQEKNQILQLKNVYNENEIRERTKELGLIKLSLEDSNKTIAVLKSQIQLLSQNINTVIAEKQKIFRTLKEKDIQIEDANTQINLLSSMKSDLSAQNHWLSEEIENVKKKHIGRNNNDKSISNDQSNTLKAQIEELTYQRTKNQEALSQNQRMLLQTNLYIASLETKCGQYKDQLTASLSELNQKEEMIVRAKQQLTLKIESQQKMIEESQLETQKRMEQKQTELQILTEQQNKRQKSLEDQIRALKKTIANSPLNQNEAVQNALTNCLFQGTVIEDYFEHKRYLKQVIENHTKYRITKTKLIYAYDELNKLNFHKYVDGYDNIVLIVKMANGTFTAGYSEGRFESKLPSTKDGLVISLTHKKYFTLVQKNRRAITYDDFYIIFGNSELRLKSLEKKLFSNFGISNGYYSAKGEKVSVLLGGSISDRELELEHYEFYQVFFDYD